MHQLAQNRWYALQCRAGREAAISQILQAKGYDNYLPTYPLTDPSRLAGKALFPGYIFCRMRERPSALVVTTPGVVRFVGIGKSASAIPDYEIEAIDRLVASGLNLSPQAFMTSGQRIVVTAGPLQGLTGVLISVGKRHRLIVSVDLLMRSISAEVDIHDVEIEKTDGTLRPPSYHATITDLRPKH